MAASIAFSISPPSSPSPPSTPITAPTLASRKRKTRLPGTHNIDPPTNVKVYKGDGSEYTSKGRDGEKGKFEVFVETPSRRQDSRRWFTGGLAKKIKNMKQRTGDEVMVVIKDADRHDVSCLTTNPSIFTWSGDEIPTEGNPGTPGPSGVNSSAESPSIPSFHELALASPSKSFRPKAVTKPTARKINLANYCRGCGIKSGSADDVLIESPWIGCDFEEKEKPKGSACAYWIHACCHGFPDATVEECELFSFICDFHNTKKKAAKVRGAKQRDQGRRGGCRTRGGKNA